VYYLLDDNNFETADVNVVIALSMSVDSSLDDILFGLNALLVAP